MYESFFGLTGLPFQLTPDASFVFDAKGHRNALLAIQQGLAGAAGIMVVTGEAGAGKTTLLQAVLASVDRDSFVAVHISAARLDEETLADRVSDALGLVRLADPVARREALLAKLRAQPDPILLVIDEAQHLATDGFALLETMAEVAGNSPAPLRICLFGQPELRILLNAAERSGFRERIDVDRHLGPLEHAEIRSYVEHRLRRAGWTGRPEFDDAAFFEIFVFTAGIPRRVNLLCNSLMLSAWINRQQRIDAPAVTQVAARMREDSFQGELDLQQIGSSFNHPSTLVEEGELQTPATDAQPRDADHGEPAVASETSTMPDSTTTPAGALSLDGSPQATRASEPTPLAGDDAVHRAESSGHRRHAILTSAASVAIALALVAYIVEQRSSHPSESKRELRGVVAEGGAAPDGSTAAINEVSRSTASALPSASSASASTRPVPEPERPLAPTAASPAPERPPVQPSCSGPAFALGLCDADPSSPRRP